MIATHRMIIERDEPSILWVEGDDDARIVGGSCSAPESLLAYALLGRPLVLHPAYVWQSPQTHRMVLNDSGSLLVPPHAKLVLGDSSSTADYMRSRVAKLREAKDKFECGLVELAQYERYGAERITAESEALDERFGNNKGIHGISWSRDKKFRRLLRAELITDDPLGNQLFGLILRARGSRSERIVHRAKDKLVEMTGEPGVVSRDSVIAALLNEDLERDRLDSVFRRLTQLHWESNHDEGIVVPMLGRLKGKLDPYDPVVFWAAVKKLIGPGEIRALMGLPWAEACRVVSSIREDGTWQKFLQKYVEIVESVAAEFDGLREKEVVRRVLQEYPSLRKMLWRSTGRVALLSFVCGVISLYGSITGGVGITLSGIGFACTGLSGHDVYRRWISIAGRYNQSDRQDLQTRLRSFLRSAGWSCN